jgi:hypothetical protein
MLALTVSGIEKIEPHAPVRSTPFLRCVPKELGGPASPFTAPFVCRFDEPGTLKGTPKTGFVQALAEQ